MKKARIRQRKIKNRKKNKKKQEILKKVRLPERKKTCIKVKMPLTVILIFNVRDV